MVAQIQLKVKNFEQSKRILSLQYPQNKGLSDYFSFATNILALHLYGMIYAFFLTSGGF
jgi:hypothetical protein